MLQVVATKKNFYKPASPAWKAGGILPSRSSNGAAESSPELSLKPKASVLVVWGPYLVSPQSWVLNLIVAVIELWIELCIELWSQQCNWTWWLQLGIAKVGNTWVETTKKMGGRWVVGYAPGEVVKQSGWKSIHHEPKWVESSGRSDILNWMKKVDIVTSCNLFIYSWICRQACYCCIPYHKKTQSYYGCYNNVKYYSFHFSIWPNIAYKYPCFFIKFNKQRNININKFFYYEG